MGARPRSGTGTVMVLHPSDESPPAPVFTAVTQTVYVPPMTVAVVTNP